MSLRSKQKCVPEVHEKAVHLKGYGGDSRKETAEVVIPKAQVGGSSNDIGFKRTDKGTFQAIISEFDRSYYSADWLKKLNAVYAEKKARKIATTQGYEFVGRREVNGHVKLQFRVQEAGF